MDQEDDESHDDMLTSGEAQDSDLQKPCEGYQEIQVLLAKREELSNNIPIGAIKRARESTSLDSDKYASLDYQNNIKVALETRPLEG